MMAPDAISLAHQLGRLADLKAQGLLTGEEFNHLKERVINAFSMEGSQQEPPTYDPSSTTPKSFGNDVRLRDIVTTAYLGQFLDGNALTYYSARFQALVKAGGIGDIFIQDVRLSTLLAAWRKLPWKQRINIPGLFFGVFWGCWRGVATIWWIIGIWILLLLIDIAVTIKTGDIPRLNFYLPTYFWFGLAGDALFLLSVVRKARANAIAMARSSGLRLAGVVTGLCALVGAGVIAADGGYLFLPGCGAPETKTFIEELALKSIMEGDAGVGMSIFGTAPITSQLSNIRERVDSSSKKRLCTGDLAFLVNRAGIRDPKVAQAVQSMIAYLLRPESLDFSIQKLEDGQLYYRLKD